MVKKAKKEDRYGFVYIWRDRKHKRFYIGSHWGTEDDGYICSSNWMRDSYKRRPNDFKRRILARIYTHRNDLLQEEQKWLNLIQKHEMGNRYYNKSKSAFYPICVLTPEQKEQKNAMFHEKCVGWNKGFTKETHPQLAKSLEARKKSSEAQKGVPKGYTGWKFYNNGEQQIMCDPETAPKGWKKGRINDAWNKGIKTGLEPWNKGKKGVQIPWNKGLTKDTDKRLIRSQESKDKHMQTIRNKKLNNSI